MKKAIYSFIFIVVLFLFFGCEIGLMLNDSESTEGPIEDIKDPIFSGSIIINFGRLNSKTILPSSDDLTISHYDVTATGPDGHSFEFLNATETSIEKKDLIPGLWTITVYAKNAHDTIIAAGSEDVVIVNSTTININLLPLDGQGSLSIDLSWPPDTIDNPSIEATLRKLGDTPQSIPFPAVSMNQVSYEYSTIDSGAYTIIIDLKDSGITVATIIDSITILQDITTVATIELSTDEINQPPAAPTDLSAVESADSITVSWNDNSDTELSYCIERSPLDETNFTVLDNSLSANTTYFVDTTVDPDTTYFYRVKANNTFGDSSYSNSDQSVLDYPESNPVISGNPSTINPNPEFSWAAVNGATRYRYQLNSESGDWNGTNEMSCSLNITSNGNYTLYVQAGDDAGNWSASGTFNFEFYWNQLSTLNDDIIRPNGSYITSYVNNGLLFSVKYDSGIEIFDLSTDAENPESLSSLPVSRIVDICVQGNYAFAALYDFYNVGFNVIDISNPRAPFIVSELSIGASNSVTVNGNYAYFASITRGLVIVDISDPTSPFIEKEIYLDGDDPEDIFIQGNYAYVAAGSSLRIVKIDDPSNASVVNTIQTGGANGLFIDSNNYAYVVNDEGLQIINVDFPETATESDIIGSYTENLGEFLNVTVKDDYAYVSQSSIRPLAIINVTDKASPQYVNSQPMLSSGGIAIYGNNAYIGNGTEGYAVLDITDPENVVVAANHYVFQPYDVCVSGNYAFVAGGVTGLKILDISDPYNPVIEKTIDIKDAIAVDIKDNYLFVLSDYHGVVVVYIESNITDSAIVSEITNVNTHGLLIYGDYAFTYGTANIYAIDISDPINIDNNSLITTIPYSMSAIQLATDGNYLYVASSYDGLDIIDITDMATASVIKNIDTERAYGVAVNGNYVYLSDDYNIIYTIDVTDPVNASIVNTIDSSDYGSHGRIFIKNNNLFVTSFQTYSYGIYILDIYDPLSSVFVKSIPCSTARKIFIYDDSIYAMSDDLGLVIIGE